MDNFIFIAQTGDGKRNPKSCTIVRAHVLRKYWQDKKAPKRTRVSEHTAPKLFPSISNGSDELVYAGSSLDADSYPFFKHYGSEFTVILCDTIQPIIIKGPGVCCTQAVQMNSPALMHAICFQAAAHVAVCQANLPLRPNMFRDPDHSYGLEEKALYHKAKALTNLRNSIYAIQDKASAASEASILCIAILLAAEAMMGDAAGLQAHEYGLKQLIAAQGGMHMLSIPTASLVRFVDVKASIAQERAPWFKSKSCLGQQTQACHSSTQPCHQGDDVIESFGLGFVKLSAHFQVHPALLLCITQIKRLTLGSLTTSGPYQSHEQYSIDDFVEIDHALQSMNKNCELSTLDECIRLALLLFTNVGLWRTPLFFNWIRHLSMKLKISLLILDSEPAIQACTDFLLWITLLGRYSARMETDVERCWWSKRIENYAARARLTSFHQVREIISAFAYADDIFAPAWEQIWNDDILGSTKTGSSKADGQVHPCDFQG